MMPPVDRIHEQNEQDPGRVAHTRQAAVVKKLAIWFPVKSLGALTEYKLQKKQMKQKKTNEKGVGLPGLRGT